MATSVGLGAYCESNCTYVVNLLPARLTDRPIGLSSASLAIPIGLFDRPIYRVRVESIFLFPTVRQD